jgi:O-antigen biosynthesis protein
VAKLLSTIEAQPAFIGFVSNGPSNDSIFTGTFDQLGEVAEIYSINEIIFCAKSIPSRQIIDKMSSLRIPGVEYKIAPPESLSLIGSNSINTAGDLYTMEINSIGKFTNRRNKRFLDFSVGLLMIPALPVLFFIVKNPFRFVRNLFQVLAGVKTWVGYCNTGSVNVQQLPRLKTGVLNPSNALHISNLGTDTLDRLNLLYARDYKIKSDLDIIFKGLRLLGN